MTFTTYEISEDPGSWAGLLDHLYPALDHARIMAQAARPADWRIGQTWYNALPNEFGYLISGSPCDPFNVEDNRDPWKKILEASAHLERVVFNLALEEEKRNV